MTQPNALLTLATRRVADSYQRGWQEAQRIYQQLTATKGRRRGFLTTVLWLAVMSVATAQEAALAQRVSWHYANVPLGDFLRELSSKYQLQVAYTDNQLPMRQPITAQAQDEPLNTALSTALANARLGYTVVGTQVVIRPAPPAPDGRRSTQKRAVSGYVRDAANGEGLIGSPVLVKELGTGTVTNAYGFYALSLPKGTYALVFSYLGYTTQTRPVTIDDQDITLDVQLAEQATALREVKVSAEKPDQNVRSTEMSVNKLDIQTIKSMPALLGEVDIVRSIQLLPGVSTVGEGATGFNVRGGSIDQNLILLDEAPVYSSSHLFGLFSVFNPDAVKDVKLLKGGIPAMYGGRLSSVLDVRMKEGNNQRFTAEGGIGTVSSRLTVQAPIVKDKGSFIVAARRTYADALLQAVPTFRGNAAYFYDLSAKANYTLNDRNKLFVSGYLGRDAFNFGTAFRSGWGNGTGTVRWNHLFNRRLFANFTALYSNYDYSLGAGQPNFTFNWLSRIVNYSGKGDFTYYLAPHHTLNFGAGTIYYQFDPADVTTGGERSAPNKVVLPQQRAWEYAVYLDHEYTISPRLSVQYGLRYSLYNYVGAGTVVDYQGQDGFRKTPVNPRTFGAGQSIAQYGNLEPRASLRYTLNETSSVKASYNRMAQYVHLISNTTAATPLDVWSPTTNNIRPQLADQVAAGYFRNVSNNTYELSAEGFYKTMTNQIDYIDGAELLVNTRLEGDLLYGRGRAYGVELLVRKNAGRLTGWVSYTLSRSERQINGINNNQWYVAKYDKTHNLAVVATYRLAEKLSLSANFTYGTGVATTFPNARYEIDGLVVPHNTDNARNNFRVPAYHRLDFALTWDRKKPGRRWEGSWVLSVYNVYNRRNPFTIFFRQNADNPNQTEAVRLSVLGSVLPSVTYNFKF